MRSTKLPYLIMLLLFVVCFSLEAWLDIQIQPRQQPAGSAGILNALMGDSRRMFANHFFVKADAYFHSGFYPTIFDNQESFQTPHMAEDAGALKSRNQGEETAFMGKPRDFIEAFERHFYPAVHTHLDQGGPQGINKVGGDLGEAEGGDVREILPWLQLSATLDPERIETYMVTAYWLRKRMGKVDEAEQFLREGLHANPGNPALLFELGRVFEEDRKEIDRPRNVWQYAVRVLDAKATTTDQDDFMLSQLALRLARLEEEQGNLTLAIHWLERYKPLSPNPVVISKQIEELKRKISEGKSAVYENAATTQTK